MAQEVIEYKGFWTIRTTRQYSEYIFIFGDNDIKRGKKGQAVIRDQPNAFGIPTKKLPSLLNEAFYTDDEFDQNKSQIDGAIELIKQNLPNYKGIIYPESGLGTGLAQLDTRAPRTFEYLTKSVQELIEYVKSEK